jgi:phosphatidylethanolamine-binding protein (PEBP) family uncharacterized protein
LGVVYFVISGKQKNEVDLDSFPEFEVTSQNLNNGTWDDVISNTAKGNNESPQLRWEAVNGAEEYVVVMIDEDGNNWLHMYVATDKTCLEQGEYSGVSDGYVGPYPPSGTHKYIVYVFALKEAEVTLAEKLDAAGASIADIVKELNSCQGTETGNILSIGKLMGKYKA